MFKEWGNSGLSGVCQSDATLNLLSQPLRTGMTWARCLWGNIAGRGTSLQLEEERTRAFWWAETEELHFSALQDFQLLRWLCELRWQSAWCWWATEQTCTSLLVMGQLITWLPLHFSFCFLFACPPVPIVLHSLVLLLLPRSDCFPWAARNSPRCCVYWNF